jgi:hypothetical protein
MLIVWANSTYCQVYKNKKWLDINNGFDVCSYGNKILWLKNVVQN